MRRSELDGAPVDKQRRQALMNPRWASNAVVKASLAPLCDLLFQIYGRRYVASEPKVLLTLPGARPQMPHGDAADKDQLGNPRRMIGVVMEVEDDAVLDAWPVWFCDLTAPGEEQCAVRTSMVERTIVPMGGAFVFRGDMEHRGVDNRALSRVLRRVYAYLSLRDAPMTSETWRDETCPVKENPSLNDEHVTTLLQTFPDGPRLVSTTAAAAVAAAAARPPAPREITARVLSHTTFPAWREL